MSLNHSNLGTTLASIFIACLGFGVLLTSHAVAQQTDAGIELEKAEDRIHVWIKSDGQKEKFTEYRFTQPTKPILFPVFAFGETHVTRQHPMYAGNADEQKDHPHHKSIWFAHGDINGIDFWSEKAVIKNRTVDLKGNQIQSINDWLDGDQKICADETTVRFGCSDEEADFVTRWIDYQIKITASEQPITFGDTKEGTFAIRTAPGLRIVDKQKNPVAKARNSGGVEGGRIWGKKSKWVCYAGHLDDRDVSIAVFDHPNNLRHPTTWHAREYGLIAANPFGLHHFEGAKKGTGNHTVAKGKSITFRYRILIVQSHPTDDWLNTAFDQFASSD